MRHFFFFKPFEYIVGGWDPGVYVNTGVNISNTGALRIDDPFLAAMQPEDQEVFYHVRNKFEQNPKYPGFHVFDKNNGKIMPYFYHLFPVWIALLYSVAGIWPALLVNAFFGIFSVLGFYLLGRELFSKNAGLLAAFLLVFNLAQVWRCHFPTSEILVQFLLFSGFYTLMLADRKSCNFCAFVSGFCFAEAFLARISIALVLFFILSWLYISNIKKVNRTVRWFFYGFLPVFIYACAYHWFVASMPTSKILTGFKFFEYRNWILLILIGFCFLGAVLRSKSADSFRNRIWNILSSRNAKLLFICLITIIAGYGYFVRPYIASGSQAGNFPELGMIVSPVIILCAFCGLIIMMWKGISLRKTVYVFVVLPVTVYLIYNKQIVSSYMWAERRYIPVVIPFIILSASYFVTDCLLASGKLYKKLIATGVVCYIFFVYIPGAWPIIRHNEFPGIIEFCDKLSSDYNTDDLLIFSNSWLATPLQYVYGKNTLQLSDQQYADKIPQIKKAVKLVEQWVHEGRKVYYISFEEKPFSTELRFVPFKQYPLYTRSMERRVGALPVNVHENKAVLNSFRIELNDFDSKSGYGSETVNTGPGGIGLIQGFSDLDKYKKLDPDKLTFRWSSKISSVNLPLDKSDKLSSLLVRMKSNRPDGLAEARVEFSVNGEKANSVVVPSGKDFLYYSVDLDNLKTSNNIILELSTNTWNPASENISADNRNLGVIVDKIKYRLSGQNGQEKAIEIDIGVDDDSYVNGFYQKEGSGIVREYCRFFDKFATLVIPWMPDADLIKITVKCGLSDFSSGEKILRFCLQEGLGIKNYNRILNLFFYSRKLKKNSEVGIKKASGIISCTPEELYDAVVFLNRISDLPISIKSSDGDTVIYTGDNRPFKKHSNAVRRVLKKKLRIAREAAFKEKGFFKIAFAEEFLAGETRLSSPEWTTYSIIVDPRKYPFNSNRINLTLELLRNGSKNRSKAGIDWIRIESLKE